MPDMQPDPDEERLTLSPDYRAAARPPARRGGREPWEALEERLERAAQDPRYDPYDSQVEGRLPPRRRDRRTPTLLILAAAAAVVFCIAFALAPLMAFRAVRSAAQYGDVAALQELVDYNAVRQSLRTQVRPASVERRPPSDFLHDPLGTLRRAWEPVSPQTDVNIYLGPEALAALSMGRRPEPGVQPPPATGGLYGGPVPAVRYWGVDRVRLGVKDPSDPARETVFTFQRRTTFGWRLAGVRLPERLP